MRTRNTCCWMTVAALAAMFAGCASQEKAAQSPSQQKLVVSRTLQEPLPQITRDAIAARQRAGLPLPPDHDSAPFVQTSVDSLVQQFRHAFAVTEQQEAMFALGQFDDRGNAEKVTRLLGEVERRNVPLNTVSAYLAAGHEMNALDGVRLELAARLIEAQVQSGP